MAGDWFDENAPVQPQGDWFDQNKPQPNTAQPVAASSDQPGILKRIGTGFVEKVKHDLTTPMLPVSQAIRELLPKEKMSPTKEALAGGALTYGNLMDNLSTPGTAALGAGASVLSEFGLPGMIVGAGFSADQLRRSYQTAKQTRQLSPDALTREKVAGYGTALSDALFALLPWLRREAGGVKKPARMNFDPGKTSPTAPELPLPVGAAPRTAVPAAPSIPDIPLEAPKQPWYEMEQYKPKAKAVPAPSKPIPPWSRPAPTPEYFPGVGHVEPEVYPQVKGMIDNRMQAALDLFESGVGEVSRKGKNIEGIENMNYGAIDRADMGFGNVPVKRAFPELSGVKGSPKQIADAIRRDKNNPKYLQIRDAMTDAVFRENSDHIDNLNENAVVNREERLGLQGKFGDESGFADISRRKGRSVPGESVPFDDLTGQAWMMPDGSVVKVKDHWTAMEEFLGKDTASFKDAADQGMIRIRKAPRTLDVETFAPEATPEQRQTLLKYARENPDIALTWEGKNKDFQSKWGNDWDSLKKRLFGEEGFARVDKNQKGFEFRPMNVPGQSRTQVMQDLYNQILQAPDSNVSKRELLGMQTRKPAKAVAETPLFKESALQPVKPSPAELDKQFIDQYLGGRPLSEAVEANKQNYSPDLDMQMADQVLGKNWRFQR